jgi:FkbM family methyltransferase
MISYAQNLEDVILYRALGSLEKGFYIDVGAQGPVVDSVTKWFYDHGWRGVNVEPVAAFHRELTEARPRDVNLQMLLGEEDAEEVDFHVVPETGLSSINEAQARESAEAMAKAVETVRLPQRTLDGIFQDHVDGEVHFLKVDVEGAEEAVLRGWRMRNVLPWVIVVEGTRPNSSELTERTWEPGLLDAGYKRAYFDGLNFFYVSGEHPELTKHFGAPPNVLDSFRHYTDIETAELLESTRRELHRVESVLAHRESISVDVQALLTEAREKKEKLRSTLDAQEKDIEAIRAVLQDSLEDVGRKLERAGEARETLLGGLATREAEVARLAAQLKDTEELKGRFAALEARAAQLESDLVAATRAREDMGEALAAAERSREDAEAALAGREEERDATVGELAGLRAERERMERELRDGAHAAKELQATLAARETDLHKAQQSLNARDEELRRVREELTRAEYTRAELQKEVDAQGGEQGSLRQERDALQTKLRESESALEEARRNLEAREGEHARMESEMTEAKEQADTLRAELEASTARTRELEETLAERKSRVNTLDNQVTQVRKRAESLAERCTELEARLSVAQGRADAMRSKLDTVQKSAAWRITQPLHSIEGLIRRRSKKENASSEGGA